MSMKSGLCLGGPLDGKRLDHYGPRYRVPLAQPLTDFRIEDADKISSTTTVDVFEYVHFELPVKGNPGFWIPEQVSSKRGRYEHQRYDHPYDFIVRRLMACYRPDGY